MDNAMLSLEILEHISGTGAAVCFGLNHNGKPTVTIKTGNHINREINTTLMATCVAFDHGHVSGSIAVGENTQATATVRKKEVSTSASAKDD